MYRQGDYLLVLLVLCLHLGTGCTSDATDGRQDRDPYLTGSETIAAATNELQTNIAFWTGGSRCSGALVGPRAILTAAHCLPRGEKTGLLHYTRSHSFAAVQADGSDEAVYHHYPRFKSFDSFKTPDVGVIELASPLPGPYALIDHEHLEDGKQVIVTGYEYDPDKPTRYTLKYFRGAAFDFRQHFFGTVRSSEHATQGGDSGGPVYRHRTSLNGEREPLTIIGVHSGWYRGAEIYNVANRLSSDSVSTWLRGVLDGMPACRASEERCDGVDNDCDGVVDNVSASEVCDGVDNDCDGVIDRIDGKSVCPECAPGVMAEMTSYDPSTLVCDADALPCDHCVYSLADDKLYYCRRSAGGFDSYLAADEQLACDATRAGEVLFCGGGQLVCDGAGNWAAATTSVEVCDGLDNDGDGQIDETFPQAGKSCDSGALGQCRIGTYRCDGVLYCTASVKAKPEMCDGLDNDCDGVTDNGASLGSVRAMEYLSEEMTQALFGVSVKSLLFVGWPGQQSTYAAYQVEPQPSKMLAVGPLAQLVNQFAKSPLFANDQEVAELDGIMAVPAGFDGQYANDTLVFFIKNKVRRLDLVTHSVAEVSLASLGLPADAYGQSLVTDRIDSASVVRPSDHPGVEMDYIVAMRGDKLWLHCSTCGINGGAGWAAPTIARDTWCTGDNDCPPALTTLESFTRRPAAGQNSHLAASIGSNLYHTVMQTDSNGAIAFDWQAPILLQTLSCAHP